MKRLSIALLLGSAGILLYGQTHGTGDQPAPYAQKLVNQELAKHPEIVIMAMHVIPPDSADNQIIASNIGRIGKKADDDDMRVIQTGKPNLEVNKAGNHFEVEMALLDTSGNTIGAVSVVYNYRQGDDKAKLQRKAEQVRDDLRNQIPDLKSLFHPAE